ncbi:MAG: SIMPL domain-containing protein [Parafilimonas sp.]
MKKILMLIIAGFGFFNAKAQDNTIKQRTINVNGSASIEVVPDEIYVQVDLREYTKKNGDKIDIETIRNNFLASAKSIGLKDSDVSIQSYQGWDGNYWWYKKNKKQNPDMKASIVYQVKLSSVNKMNELVDKLDDEATQNFSISKVSHSKIEEFKKQLKIGAVKAAKDKALYLAEAINEHVGEAITINDPGEINVYPQPYYNTMMKAGAEADQAAEPPLNVDFKKIKLQFEVNVVFALK